MTLFRTVVGIFCITIFPYVAVAADYPDRPVTMIVPSSPGGGLDVLGRLMADQLGKRWGQAVLPDNRAGANGVVGTQLLANATADGYTLGILTTNFTINPSMYTGLPYETPDSFQPISIVVTNPNVTVVNPAAGIKSIKELIAYAKAHPGEVTYGSSGIGSSGHLTMALLEQMAGIKMTHIPYAGAGDAAAAVVKGEVMMLTTSIGAAKPFIVSRQVIPIAVTTAKRSVVLPDVPTIAEAGLSGYDVGAWYGIMAPANSPKDVVAKIHDDIVAILAEADVVKRINDLGFDVLGNTPDQFGTFLSTELTNWEKTVSSTGIKPEAIK